MTTYRVPYTFIPGTKAKATEVNANFNAVVDLIEGTNNNCADKNLSNISPSGKQVIYENSSQTRMIGEIVTSTVPLTDSGLHLLDGSLISGGGVYNDFVTHIAGLISSYPNLFCSEETWQASITNYGVCGKFVYNSANNTVRLPKISGFIEGTDDTDIIGDLVEAGLPNITGRNAVFLRYNSASGAFELESAASSASNIGAQTYSASQWINFDASRSSSIYGNAETVQPQSVKVLYYIVVSKLAKLNIVADIDEIATDLNTKADKDLSNTTPGSGFAAAMNSNGIRTVTETYSNGSSWYRIWSDGWCEQGSYNTNTSTTRTISLLKPLQSNYTLILGTAYARDTGHYLPGYKNKTSNGFDFSGVSSSTSINNFVDWCAKGYLLQE